jgi:hypothetical protein
VAETVQSIEMGWILPTQWKSKNDLLTKRLNSVLKMVTLVEALKIWVVLEKVFVFV